MTEVVVLEHLIQWFLVYFAIYQAVNEKMDINDINIDNFQSVFFDVSNLNLVILPTLIISWVTIFNYRMKKLQIKSMKLYHQTPTFKWCLFCCVVLFLKFEKVEA